MIEELFHRDPPWPPQLHVWPQNAPHKMAMLWLSVVGGILGLVVPNGGTSPAVRAAFVILPDALFYACMTLGAGLALLGVWRRGLLGLGVERLGLILHSVSCLAYVVAVVGASGVQGFMASLFFLALVMGNVSRIRLITKDLDRVTRLIRGVYRDGEKGEDK